MCLIIHAIFSVVHCEPDMIRSPSFSRFSSSITTRNSPAANAASASSMASNAKAVRAGRGVISVARHVDVWAGLWMPFESEEVWDIGDDERATGAIADVAESGIVSARENTVNSAFPGGSFIRP